MEERLILQDPSHGKKPFLSFGLSCLLMSCINYCFEANPRFNSTFPAAAFVWEVNKIVFFEEV